MYLCWIGSPVIPHSTCILLINTLVHDGIVLSESVHSRKCQIYLKHHYLFPYKYNS